MAFTTTLTKRLGLRHPIIQAPLAGGGDTPELIAAVSEAGAFGFIGAAYLTPPQILEAARAVRARTERPFGVSLFAPLRAPEVPKHPELALTRLAPYYAELGLTPPEIPALKPDAFPAQFAAALESAASVFSFTFGVLPADAIAAIKKRGMFLMGTATNVEEAVTLERAGVDAIVAQGSEAGARHARLLRPPCARDREPVHDGNGGLRQGRPHPAFSPSEHAYSAAPDRGGPARPRGISLTLGGPGPSVGAAPIGIRTGRPARARDDGDTRAAHTDRTKAPAYIRALDAGFLAGVMRLVPQPAPASQECNLDGLRSHV